MVLVETYDKKIQVCIHLKVSYKLFLRGVAVMKYNLKGVCGKKKNGQNLMNKNYTKMTMNHNYKTLL